MKKVRVSHILQKKRDQEKLLVLTAYDYYFGRLLDEAGVDMILVGDSLGNVFSGHETTLPVTVDQIIYHCQAVCRGAKRSLVVADMPFMSYQVNVDDAKRNAGRLVKEGGAAAVKIEAVSMDVSVFESVVQMGVPVMGHIGFTPQGVHQLGGYRVQGRSEEQVDQLCRLAESLAKAGCFSLVLEMVPSAVAQRISSLVDIPTIGIGAGQHCDGQILVTQDVLGMSFGDAPSFVRPYDQLTDRIRTALSGFQSDVKSLVFPSIDQQFS